MSEHHIVGFKVDQISYCTEKVILDSSRGQIESYCTEKVILDGSKGQIESFCTEG